MLSDLSFQGTNPLVGGIHSSARAVGFQDHIRGPPDYCYWFSAIISRMQLGKNLPKMLRASSGVNKRKEHHIGLKFGNTNRNKVIPLLL
jgi:hypothetical protein